MKQITCTRYGTVFHVGDQVQINSLEFAKSTVDYYGIGSIIDIREKYVHINWPSMKNYTGSYHTHNVELLSNPHGLELQIIKDERYKDLFE